MKYPCKGCGACCKHIGSVVNDARRMAKVGGIQTREQADLVGNLAEFPYAFDDDGRCEKLIGDKCSVYAVRPFVCNVVRVWKKLYRKKVPWKQYVAANFAACEKHRELELLQLANK